ncbi:MAG: hypothetical protein HQ562_11365 [Candidatus Marinimicrobia bacterium]|nr:hypothetical protein [Candidatus Neomarinimicrobiota bacterium]
MRRNTIVKYLNNSYIAFVTVFIIMFLILIIILDYNFGEAVFASIGGALGYSLGQKYIIKKYFIKNKAKN